MHIEPGLYEEIISIALDEAISSASGDVEIETDGILASDSNIVLSRYALKILERGLKLIIENYSEDKKKYGVQKQIQICNEIIDLISDRSKDPDIRKEKIGEEAKRLLFIKTKQSSIKKEDRPDTPLSVSSLFTGSKFEPKMVNELKKEILTADRIDFLVSFIKNTGLASIFDELEKFTNRGGMLRIITTTYMGATDSNAIIRLHSLPNTEIKISYDSDKTRHHAKSYIFRRNTGYDTAYVGSSNLSGAAISGGLEWNVKLTTGDTAHLINGVKATFESYWESKEFVLFDETQTDYLVRSLNKSCDDRKEEYLFDIEPYPHQKEVLEELEAERTVHGRYRNLIVSATGTGKTIISALDYRRFCQRNPGKKNSLLFIAHREEILVQSLKRFRGVLKDHNFGDLFVGNKKPSQYDHIFMSIQTFRSNKFETQTSKKHFDFIVVDETHHGAAESYQELLTYYEPKILLGMTATPERMDGLDIKKYFDNTIASEIRLGEAIDKNMLVPFQYFGITDNVDASLMRFENGRYNSDDLDAAYIGNLERVDIIQRAIKNYAPSKNDIIGLGFCCSQEHAKFMSDQFNKIGYPSVAVISKTSDDERSDALERIKRKELNFIFTVDLYNEGVDIPQINTVLFLRPTESLTVFIQQLGRGLRHSLGKEELVVLDFIGQANKRYSFERKLATLTTTTTTPLLAQIEKEFVDLPRGCSIQLEKVAKEHVLTNIKNAYVNDKVLISRIKSYAEGHGNDIRFDEFLKYNGMAAQEFYLKSGSSFYDLCYNAGVLESPYKSHPDFTGKTFMRMSNFDSRRVIQRLREIFDGKTYLDEIDEKILLMLLYSIYPNIKAKEKFDNLAEFVDLIKNNKFILKEILELLNHNYENIKFVDKPLELGFDNALDLHCAYTRDQILSAIGYFNFNERHPMLEGVRYLKKQKTDIFLVTLEKMKSTFLQLQCMKITH